MRYLAILFLIIFCTPAQAAPKFPALTGRVVDDAHILSAQTQNTLTALLESDEAQTTNQVVVVTIPSLQGGTIEDYGVHLGRVWQIGQKDKNNGVILLIAPKEHKVRIEVGYGLEGKLTDVLSEQIIQNIILPKFRAGDMEQGTIDGTTAILNVLNGGALPQAVPPRVTYQHSSGNHNYGGGALLIFGFYLVIAFIHLIINSIIYVYYKLVGRPVPSRFTTDRLANKSGWGKLWYFSGLTGSGFFGGSGGFSGGGFSGGGGSFGGGGASGGW